MNSQTNRIIVSVLLSAIVLGTTPGCAITKPFVKQGQDTLTQVGEAKRYEEAVALANCIREEIVKKQTSLHNFEFWSGATLLGVGIASAGLGVFGASHDALIGTALGGGAIVGVKSYVPIKERKKIYNDALDTIEKAKVLSAKFETSKDPLPFPEDNSANEARYLVAQANDYIRQANTFNETRGENLLNALKDIVLATNKRLTEETLNAGEALAAATKKLEEARQTIEKKKEEAQSTMRMLMVVKPDAIQKKMEAKDLKVLSTVLQQ